MVRTVRYRLGVVRGRRVRGWLVRGWLIRRLERAAIAALVLGFAAGAVVAQGQPAAQGQPVASAREVRLALVIGESDYAAGVLPTGANDAGLVAQALSRDGFDVTARADVDAATLRKLAHDFTDRVDKAGPDAFVVVYLAGYGLQFGNDDFLAPVEARIDRDADVPGQAVALDELFHPLELMPARARLLITDLAHATPFIKGDPPLAAGLALRQPPPGTLYAFNAMPGTLAAPDTLPYGAYARALTEMMATPGLPLATLFDRVRLRTGVLTDGADVPWNAGAPDPSLTFVPPLAQGTPDLGALANADAYSTAIERDTLLGYAAAVKAAAGDRQAPRLRAILSVMREAAFWSACAKADVPRAYWTYLRRYPRGSHLLDARRRLAALKAPLEPPPRFDILTYDDVPAPSAEEAALASRSAAIPSAVTLTDPAWPPIPAPPPGLLPAPAAAGERLAAELTPPPLVPPGVLPIPLPATPSARVMSGRDQPHRVTQPDVPGYGQVVAETRPDPGGPALTMSANGKPLFRVVLTTGSAGERLATQADAAGAVISRTTILRRDGELTILQTGPDGGALSQVVSRLQPDGSRRTVVTDGHKAIVATIRGDEAGIVAAVTLAPTQQPNPPFKPAASGQGPVLAPHPPATVGRPSPAAGSERTIAAADAAPALAPPSLPPVVFPITEPPPAPSKPATAPAPEPAKGTTPEPRQVEAAPPHGAPEPPRRDASKQETAKQEAAKPEAAKQDPSKQEAAKPEPSRRAPTRKQPARREPARKEQARKVAARPAPIARGKQAKGPPRQAARARATPARRPPAVHIKKHR